jgi:hypothetical protein
MEDLDASKDLSYQECRVKILETSEIVTTKQEDQDVQGAMESPHR